MGPPPKAVFASRRHEAGSGAAAVTLFNGTLGCTIYPSHNLTFLGSGDRGHAFSTVMKCPNTQNDELVAFKIAKTWSSTVVYINSSNIDRKRRLYERMIQNDSNNKGYFSVQLGTVLLPREMLYEAMNIANANVYRKVENVSDSDEATAKQVLVADAFTACSGQGLHLVLRRQQSLSTRRQIAKDLVYIYRQMYDKQVSHPDVRLEHILYSQTKQQTMLIDFEEFAFLEDIDEKYLESSQQAQLWQLFALVGNVCKLYHSGQKDFSFHVPWGATPRTRNKTDVLQRLPIAMKECEFDRPMVWRNETGINVAQTYEDLANWCGL